MNLAYIVQENSMRIHSPVNLIHKLHFIIGISSHFHASLLIAQFVHKITRHLSFH